jgi:protein-disulfide isomerase
MQPIDEAVDHVLGAPCGPVIAVYGDYQCPYSRRAFRELERVRRRSGEAVRIAFRHFPLTEIHPNALAAAAAAEAAALQGAFWEMHELLFHRQNALGDDYLRRYAAKLNLDMSRFEHDRGARVVLARVQRDVESALATGEVTGTPTLFIDGVIRRGSYKAEVLLDAVGYVEMTIPEVHGGPHR